MQTKLLMEAMCAVAFVTSIVSSAYDDKATTITHPYTGDKVTLQTDQKGTYVRYSNGPSGYIITRPYNTPGPSAGLDRHDDYVRDYEKGGYVKDK